MSLVGAELLRLVNRRAGWILASTSLGFGLLVLLLTSLSGLSLYSALNYTLTMGSMLGIGVALTLAATFIGGEFSSRNIVTWLTFEPRRDRVFWSKVAAVGIWSGLLSAVFFAVLGATSLIAALISNYDLYAPAAMTYPRQLALAWLATVWAGTAAAALAFATRHTAGVLGVLAGYVIVVDLLIGAIGQSVFQAASLTLHVVAFINGRTTYTVQTCAPNYRCSYTTHEIGWPQAAVVLALIWLGAMLIGRAVFARSDAD